MQSQAIECIKRDNIICSRSSFAILMISSILNHSLFFLVYFLIALCWSFPKYREVVYSIKRSLKDKYRKSEGRLTFKRIWFYFCLAVFFCLKHFPLLFLCVKLTVNLDSV